ncbi:MAG: hypothetical protein MUC74_04145 [Ideonella sp.]|jgi:hypothetical protein|nr:hypothetical protein [Ideonella sp.]
MAAAPAPPAVGGREDGPVGGGVGTAAQAARIPRITAVEAPRRIALKRAFAGAPAGAPSPLSQPDSMWLLLLEALAALLILVGIVWWTMFSGRRGGERRARSEAVAPPPPARDTPDGPPTA